jgi:hypothetical protein
MHLLMHPPGTVRLMRVQRDGAVIAPAEGTVGRRAVEHDHPVVIDPEGFGDRRARRIERGGGERARRQGSQRESQHEAHNPSIRLHSVSHDCFLSCRRLEQTSPFRPVPARARGVSGRCHTRWSRPGHVLAQDGTSCSPPLPKKKRHPRPPPVTERVQGRLAAVNKDLPQPVIPGRLIDAMRVTPRGEGGWRFCPRKLDHQPALFAWPML